MSMQKKNVAAILDNYTNCNHGIRTNLYRILTAGKLAGTGKLVILPVDQGFEHGAARSFAMNDAAYDPEYHYNLAVDAGLSAYAAPLEFLSAGIDRAPGQIPLILKMNSSNSLMPKSVAPDQAITSSVGDALRLGCCAVGLTIYPGSPKFTDMAEEAREVIREAKSYGLPSVIWSYPRGGDLSKEGETAIDVCAYAAHIAALLGAHIIKVKLPTAHIEQQEAKKVYASERIDVSTLSARVRHIVQSCFNGKRMVVFSGGTAKSDSEILEEARAIKDGGGTGSIIGRNSFQRKKGDAIELLDSVCKVYGS